jgi:hypothetical protein
MIIEETGLEGLEITVRDLDVAMKQIGFIRWAWDYKRATYDYKYVDHKNGQTYYVRVPAEAVEGFIEDSGHAVIKIGRPYVGVYTFPHGVAYDREIPQHALKQAKSKLEKLNSLLKVAEEEKEQASH